MSEQPAADRKTIRKRDRSPSFPFVPLSTAVQRLIAFEEYFKRHPAPAKNAGLAWGMKGDSSQAAQTLAALKAFGFVDYEGSGETLQASLTEEARTYLRAQQDSLRAQILRQAALKPKTIATYWHRWSADRPPDPVCLDELVLKASFTQAAAETFLRVYDQTIAFAKLDDSDTVTQVGKEGEDAAHQQGAHKSKPPLPEIEVGDYVQWTSQGVDQLKPPRKVLSVSDSFLQVHGSMSRIPMSEATLVAPPAPPKAPDKPLINSTAYRSGPEIGENDISVLLTGKRLQITADVDSEGLATLTEMIDKYQDILKLLNKTN